MRALLVDSTLYSLLKHDRFGSSQKNLLRSVGYTEMHELFHASLQVSWIWIHRELRFVLHVLPYHDILSTGRGGAADGEQQTAIKADFQES